MAPQNWHDSEPSITTAPLTSNRHERIPLITPPLPHLSHHHWTHAECDTPTCVYVCMCVPDCVCVHLILLDSATFCGTHGRTREPDLPLARLEPIVLVSKRTQHITAYHTTTSTFVATYHSITQQITT